MFCIADLEYPSFDTDLISPPSMTKGKETVSSWTCSYIIIYLVPVMCHMTLESQG